MSYCVNCGVELADSEKRCPLCLVEVINPQKPWAEPEERPYHRYMDNIMKKVDRRYFATLVGLLLAIPCIITMIANIISSGRITWSAYVLGSVALVYIFVLLPLFFKKYHSVIFLSSDCAAVLLFLLFIERVNGGNWFLGLGLPITVAAGVCIILLTVFFKRKHISVLVKSGAVLIAIGLFVVCLEVIIRLYAFTEVRLNWSLYALIPCIVLGAAAFVLEHRQNFKERVRRRLFY